MLIHEQGYENTSVTDIAMISGVVPSLINAYFLGKAGLLYAVAQRFNAAQLEHTRQAAATPGPASSRLARIIETWARIDLARPRLTAALNSLSWAWPPERETQYRADLAPFAEILRAVHADGVAAGEFRRLPEGEAFDLVLGLYLWGLRPAVFAADTAENCAARIVRHVMQVLARQPQPRD